MMFMRRQHDNILKKKEKKTPVRDPNDLFLSKLNEKEMNENILECLASVFE